MGRSTTTAAVGLVLAMTLVGCAEPEAERVSAKSTGPAEQAGEWREPGQYTFTVESACGERGFRGRFRVSVAHGKVVRAEGLDESGRGWVASGPPDPMPTLAGLVAEVESAKAESADVARLEVDPTDGRPTRITIDPSKNSIDDEKCYTISDFVS